MNQSHIKAVKDTMKLHAIVGLGKSPVKVNYVSCYCPRSCQVCKGWNDAVKTTFVAENNVSEEMDVSITEKKVTKEQKREYVEAFYENEWYARGKNWY